MSAPNRTAPTLYLRAAPDGQGGPAVRMDLVQRVVSITYEDQESKADKLTVVLDNYDLSLFDDPAFRKGMLWEIQWGYADNVTPMRRCVVTETSGGLQLSVVARAESVLLNVVERNRAFHGVRSSDVVRQIAKDAGYGTDVQHIEDTKQVHATIHQTRCTDAQLVRRLADAVGFEFYVDFDGFHFHRRQLGQRPVRVLRWFTPPVVGDILSFNLKNDVFTLPGRVVLKGRDPLERKDYEVKADARTDTERITTGSTLEVVDPEAGTSQLVQRMGSEVVRPTSSTSPATAKQEAEGRFRKSQHNAVKLELELVGDPGIMAKTVVQVEGLGKRLSGRYYVQKATHSVSPSGYSLRLEVVSDGTGGHSTESIVARGLELLDGGPPAGGKQNTAPPKPGADQVGAREGEEMEPYEYINEESGVSEVRYRYRGGRESVARKE